MNNKKPPAVHFAYGFDEQDQYEAKSRGYLSHVQVVYEGGIKYNVTFWDSIRLQQDLEEEGKLGNGFVAEPGMIVVQEITKESIESAVRKLHFERFFDSFKPNEM